MRTNSAKQKEEYRLQQQANKHAATRANTAVEAERCAQSLRSFRSWHVHERHANCSLSLPRAVIRKSDAPQYMCLLCAFVLFPSVTRTKKCFIHSIVYVLNSKAIRILATELARFRINRPNHLHQHNSIVSRKVHKEGGTSLYLLQSDNIGYRHNKFAHVRSIYPFDTAASPTLAQYPTLLLSVRCEHSAIDAKRNRLRKSVVHRTRTLRVFASKGLNGCLFFLPFIAFTSSQLTADLFNIKTGLIIRQS